MAAASPQSAVDELLAADRAFSAASGKTDVIAGLSPMFAADVVMPSPPGQLADGKAAVVAALRANADNARSQVEWTPVRGGISADGQHGFTVGFMTLHVPGGSTMPFKYLSYWLKQPDGWRVAAYKRVRSGEGSPSLALMAPALPGQLVPPSSDAAAIARSATVRQGGRSFSNAAQKIGLGRRSRAGSADAERWRDQRGPHGRLGEHRPSRGRGRARDRQRGLLGAGPSPRCIERRSRRHDRDDSLQRAGRRSAVHLPVLHDLAASEPAGSVALRGRVRCPTHYSSGRG
jgi:ketosteroid isomerase-like protein